MSSLVTLIGESLICMTMYDLGHLAAARDSEGGFTHRCYQLFVLLSVCRQKREFSPKLSNFELWFLLTTNRKSYVGFFE